MGAGGGSLVSKTKIKNNVKRAFRLPNNAVVMSMMAVILVCAAPALVSIIDDSYAYEGSSETQLLDVPYTSASFVRISGTQDRADVSYISPSENDGIFAIALNDPADVENVAYARFYGIDMAPLMSGIGTFKIITSSDVSLVNLSISSYDEGISKVSLPLTQSEVDPSVWTGSLNSVELVKLMSGAYDYMFVDMTGPNELYDMQIFAVGDYSIPYGEMIIGATGVLLLICALLATPWFSTSGLTIRRR